MVGYVMLYYGMLCYVMICYGMVWYVMITAFYNNMSYVMTCYIAAGCYVNCVLGYDKIRYVNMLHVLWCTFYTRTTIKQNRNTGYPALDPTKNKYFSVFGWETNVFMLFMLFMFFSKLFMFVFCFYVFVRL